MKLQSRIVATIPPRGIRVADLRARFANEPLAALDVALLAVLTGPQFVRVGDSIITRRQLPDVSVPDPDFDTELPRRRPRAPAQLDLVTLSVRRAAIEALRERDLAWMQVRVAWRETRRAA